MLCEVAVPAVLAVELALSGAVFQLGHEIAPASTIAQPPAPQSPPRHDRQVSLPRPRHATPDQAPSTTVERQFAILYERHSQALYRYLVKLTLGDQRLAEDIVQETYFRAWRHLANHHDTDLDTFRPWLYTVGRRLIVDMLRARRARPAEVIVEDLAQMSVTDNPVERLMTGQGVHDTLMRLRPEHRALLIELYHHGRTPAEVAEVLGIPVGTVKSRTF
jgi:RNA polymerase sigma-70 factor, ECF subfamily